MEENRKNPEVENFGTKKVSARSLWELSSLGIEMGVIMAGFAFLGQYLDRKFGYAPYLLLACSFVGFFAGIYIVIKRVKEASK
ncbi:MAG: AtpZ/AtpI family protein [Leptospiraceae bacterium]|nr:AtpZ/AtpI family protein [Leptospiraceae bacterium]MCP5499607.1 AtpZ/AtpI family protein [Leptospiraceae bacterium]